MATFSVSQVAKMLGCGKSTVTRAIKTGRVSANRRDDGGYEIDGAELARVYGLTPETLEASQKGVPMVQVTTPAETTETASRLAALDAEVAGLKALLAEVRDSRDQWRQQAERLALAAPTPAAPVPPPPRSWWRRLAG